MWTKVIPLVPFDSGRMTARPISTTINYVKNQGAALRGAKGVGKATATLSAAGARKRPSTAQALPE
jgi:hypothetical protein